MPSTPPLEDLLRTPGCNVGTLYGREVVLHFGDWPAEYAALRRGAGVVYLGHPAQIELTGADRTAFLQRLCTNDVQAATPGEGREAFLTDAKGHILAQVLAFAGQDSWVLEAGRAAAESLIAHLDFYLIQDQVQLHDRSGQWSELLLAGPQAAEILEQLTGATAPRERLRHVATPWGEGQLSLRAVTMGETPVYGLSADAACISRLWSALGKTSARPCGQRALDLLRIEHGWPLYGVDVTEKNLPQEVARDRQAIAFDKGCYLGQETVARIDAVGHVNRHLVGLRLETGELPPPGTALTYDGQPVGQITSAAVTPDFAAALALGYVRRGHDAPGTVLQSPLGPAVVRAVGNGGHPLAGRAVP